MKIRFVVAGAACLALTGTATAAGPVPPVMNGPPGIAVAGGAHVIAVAKPPVARRSSASCATATAPSCARG